MSDAYGESRVNDAKGMGASLHTSPSTLSRDPCRPSRYPGNLYVAAAVLARHLPRCIDQGPETRRHRPGANYGKALLGRPEQEPCLRRPQPVAGAISRGREIVAPPAAQFLPEAKMAAPVATAVMGSMLVSSEAVHAIQATGKTLRPGAWQRSRGCRGGPGR